MAELQQKLKDIKSYLKYSYKTTSVPKGQTYWTKVLLLKAMTIFGYRNLPATTPEHEIERSLITKGYCVSIEKFDRIWTPFTSNIYGYDPYNIPNQYVYANPRLGSGQGFDMVDGVIGFNSEVDKFGGGTSYLWETIQRYANMLAHCESTFANSLINKRIGRVGIASTTTLATAVDNVMDRIELGDTKTIQANSAMIDDLKSTNFNDTNSMSDFTQARDYLLNCFNNEIGLQTLEEKKERMIVDELSVDTEILNHNIQGMYESRLIFVEKLNYFYKDKLSRPIELYIKIGRF